MEHAFERLRAWSLQRIADPGFRERAARHPLTRWIARRRARQLFDLAAGFVYAQVLLACVQLRLFERIAAAGPATPQALARVCELPAERLQRLLDAAVALKLLAPVGAGYGLGPLGAAMVGNPAVTAMIEHHRLLYDDLRDPLALLRATGPTALARYWAYAGAGPVDALPGAAVAAYSTLMTASLALVADEVLDAHRMDRHACLLDVGGGEGGFVAAAARRHPHLRLMLFDVPAVAERARRRLHALGLGGRCVCHGGDFRHDDLPGGADVISLLRVVHDHDDTTVHALLRAAHAALPPGGTLLLAEPMAGTPGAAAMGDAYFAWYLMAMGQGRARRPAQLSAMLREAGFVRVRTRATRVPLQTGLIVARRSL